MGAALEQPVVIENRGGAGGSIGNEAAARAAPDGHTLLLGTNAMLILPQLHRRSLGYDPLRDFTPIAGLTALPHALVVPVGGPARVAELVASLKARPGQPYASGGNGSPAHLAAEMFRAKVGVDATHVPFRGAPEIVNSLLAGQLSFGFPTLSTVTEMVRAGRLQALGVTSSGRIRILPEVPAIAETLPGFDVVSWFALLGPAGLPPEIVRRVEQAALRALADKEVRARIEADGTNVLGTPAEEFVSFYRAEYQKWGGSPPQRRAGRLTDLTKR
ncbi:tripartite tricarboxylate transporter substrate binding protein, partial [Roseomonas sp. KE2513]|nr:tripartite tricarboxylate transporter substrate binding protein [Roseomonas sp. KE2513]